MSTSTSSVALPAGPPVRERGTRSRAGNAMARTRLAVLDGATRAVEKHGVRRTTMADIARLAGVAKATLYNHFRTKEDVYVAVLDAGVRDLAAECVALAAADVSEALAVAAERIAGHGALRRIAADEPAALASLVRIGSEGVWLIARQAVGDVLAAGRLERGDPNVTVVLRWLVSQVAAPGADARAAAAVIVHGLAAASLAAAPAGLAASRTGPS